MIALLNVARDERRALGYVTDATRARLEQLGIHSHALEDFLAHTGDL